MRLQLLSHQTPEGPKCYASFPKAFKVELKHPSRVCPWNCSSERPLAGTFPCENKPAFSKTIESGSVSYTKMLCNLFKAQAKLACDAWCGETGSEATEAHVDLKAGAVEKCGLAPESLSRACPGFFLVSVLGHQERKL